LLLEGLEEERSEKVKMAKKEFRFKGKTLEELKALSIREFAQLLDARKRRSLMRGLTHQESSLIEKLEKKDSVKTHARQAIVLPSMVEKTIRVHNGKEFVAITIVPEMIGMRLGELVGSRKMVTHHAPGVGATRSSANISVRG
jgi:small subunit ribosomal protein S19